MMCKQLVCNRSKVAPYGIMVEVFYSCQTRIDGWVLSSNSELFDRSLEAHDSFPVVQSREEGVLRRVANIIAWHQ